MRNKYIVCFEDPESGYILRLENIEAWTSEEAMHKAQDVLLVPTAWVLFSVNLI